MADEEVVAPVHNTDLFVYKMVLNRLPFLADTPTNKELVSNFTLEIMFELEICFKVNAGVPEEEPTHIGDEQYYSIPQRAVIADVVSCYILMLYMASSTGDTGALGGTVASTATFLKKAKAGSVEVEFDAFDVKKGGGWFTTGDSLLKRYMDSAIRKARAMGCIIDICNDCSLSVECMQCLEPALFVVRTSGDCGCGCGDYNPQRQI